MPVTTVVDRAATVIQTALADLVRHRWVHFACHGHANNLGQPFVSSLESYDGQLHLSKIIQVEPQDPEFAFLSACHTASYNELTPEESIHIAGIFQRSVVATMWAVDDTEALCMMVSVFYENMLDKSGR